jgi:hypothetical protein
LLSQTCGGIFDRPIQTGCACFIVKDRSDHALALAEIEVARLVASNADGEGLLFAG